MTIFSLANGVNSPYRFMHESVNLNLWLWRKSSAAQGCSASCPLPTSRKTLSAGRGSLEQLQDFLSFQYIDAAWETPCQSSAMKLVLVALADHADSNGYCYPGILRLAVRCSMSQRSVRNQLRKLEKAGILLTVHKTNSPNKYKLLLVIDTGKVCRTPGNKTTRTREPVAAEPSVTVSKPRGISSPERISLDKELERNAKELSDIRGQASEDAWGPMYDDAARARIRWLKARNREIKKALLVPLR